MNISHTYSHQRDGRSNDHVCSGGRGELNEKLVKQIGDGDGSIALPIDQTDGPEIWTDANRTPDP